MLSSEMRHCEHSVNYVHNINCELFMLHCDKETNYVLFRDLAVLSSGRLLSWPCLSFPVDVIGKSRVGHRAARNDMSIPKICGLLDLFSELQFD